MNHKNELNKPLAKQAKQLPKSLKVMRVLVAIGWYGGIATVAAIAVLIVTTVLFDFRIPGLQTHVWVPASITPEEGTESLFGSQPGEGLAVANFIGRIGVTGHTMTTFHSLLSTSLSVVMIVVFIWMMKQLRCVIGAIYRGDIFTTENASCLKRVGYATIVLSPLKFIKSAVSAGFMLSDLKNLFPGAETHIPLDLDWELIGLGILVLVVTYIFDVATQLKKEQDLTI